MWSFLCLLFLFSYFILSVMHTRNYFNTHSCTFRTRAFIFLHIRRLRTSHLFIDAIHDCDDASVCRYCCLINSVVALRYVNYYMALSPTRQIKRIISPFDKTLAKVCSCCRHWQKSLTSLQQQNSKETESFTNEYLRTDFIYRVAQKK